MEDYDLTKQEDVVRFMKKSVSESDWNQRCDEVKKANNGYPSFWYASIVLSGVASQTASMFCRMN